MGLRVGLVLSALLGLVVIYMMISQVTMVETTTPRIQEVTAVAISSSGLVEDDGILAVRANCLGCHSEKLITQNRASREGWESTIRWMQATQNLWDLGENESAILDYLAKNYAPQKKGRRAQLEVEWYELAE